MLFYFAIYCRFNDLNVSHLDMSAASLTVLPVLLILSISAAAEDALSMLLIDYTCSCELM